MDCSSAPCLILWLLSVALFSWLAYYVMQRKTGFISAIVGTIFLWLALSLTITTILFVLVYLFTPIA